MGFMPIVLVLQLNCVSYWEQCVAVAESLDNGPTATHIVHSGTQVDSQTDDLDMGKYIDDPLDFEPTLHQFKFPKKDKDPVNKPE